MARTEMLEITIEKRERFYASFHYLARYVWKPGIGPCIDWSDVISKTREKFPSIIGDQSAWCFCGDLKFQINKIEKPTGDRRAD